MTLLNLLVFHFSQYICHFMHSLLPELKYIALQRQILKFEFYQTKNKKINTVKGKVRKY